MHDSLILNINNMEYEFDIKNISYQPREIESFEYKVKVSRDIYIWYEIYETWARSQEFTIKISRTIAIRKYFYAYLEWEIYKNKTDEYLTKYNGNALWNWLWYKTKKEWEIIIYKYQTLWQIERDFM